MTAVYFILGTPGSGRRNLVRDLIDNGLEDAQHATVLLADTEQPDPVDAKLAGRAQTEVRRWHWTAPDLPVVELPAATTVFFFADPLVSPIDQLEALKPWLAQHHAELARIFCVVNCQLAEKNPILLQWYAALIHFADVVFLTRREGVENKWLSDFIKRFTDECFPCHFIQVKAKGELANPLLLLDPTPRRVSQYFDENETYEIDGLETDDEGEELDEEDTGLPPPEMYFVRDLSGRRSKELPDIRDFLGSTGQ